MLLPRGMLGGNVELVEVEIIRLDVGAFRHRKAHVSEDLDALVEHLGDGMDAPFSDRARAHRQRDVGLLAREPGRERLAFERAFPRVERLADAALDLVDRLPEAFALLRRHGAEPRHQL